MTATLLEHEGALVPGTVVERPNRFVLRVRFDDDAPSEGPEQSEPEPERGHLGDPGALQMLEAGSTVLCRPVDDDSRKTDWDAIAVRVEDAECWASLRPALANDLFAAALDGGYLTGFPVFDALDREPTLPDHGRADVKLSTSDGQVYVEVKSCTSMMGWQSSPTARRSVVGSTCGASGTWWRPESTLGPCSWCGVPTPQCSGRSTRSTRISPTCSPRCGRPGGVTAMSVAFEPPEYVLATANIPVELG